MTPIQKQLFEMQDKKYRDFQSRLMPTVEYEKIIGVRTPALRNFAKEISGTKEAEEFLKQLPHRYYEENNLHAFLIEKIKDYETVICETERFLPYVDNWATCDSFLPKVLSKNTDKLISKIRVWIKSERVYTVRYAIGLLMGLYLDDKFQTEYADMVASVKSDEYYINMMIAWYFATALAKQYDAALPYITENRLEKQTHNKAIQKAIESRRLTDETKAYLRTLKIR